MKIGARTVLYPIFTRLTGEQAGQEIGMSTTDLEQLVGESVGFLAYPRGKPSGDYSPQTFEVVLGLGVDAAVSTQWGTSGRANDLLQIRRLTPGTGHGYALDSVSCRFFATFDATL